MWELLFLLLPLAALSGWFIGKRALFGRSVEKLTGFNSILDRQPDKMVDAFMQRIETNQETMETHLALGNMFRRRGEVDKAIGIHQTLIAKSSLTEAQRALSLLELSRDYMRAGVLDRAENVLLELVEKGQELEASFQHLLDIYQQSKDWLRAIQTAEKWQKITNRNLIPQIAHYYCELAEQRWLKGEREDAYQYLNQALAINAFSVRASLLLGDIEANAGNYEAAIHSYQQVEDQDRAFLSEIIFPLAKCYESLSNTEEMVDYLARCLKKQPNFSVILAFSDWLYKTKGQAEAVKFVIEHLRVYPSIRGLNRLIQFSLEKAEGSAHNDLKILQELIEKMVANKPLYRCEACGFSGRTLQWQCPACKRWDVIKPLHE